MDGDDRGQHSADIASGSDAENDHNGTTSVSVGDEPRTPSPTKEEVHVSPIINTSNDDDDDDDSLPDSEDESVHSDHAQQDYYKGATGVGLDDDEVGNIATPEGYYSSNNNKHTHVVVSGGIVGHPGVGAAIIHSDELVTFSLDGYFLVQSEVVVEVFPLRCHCPKVVLSYFPLPHPYYDDQRVSSFCCSGWSLPLSHGCSAPRVLFPVGEIQSIICYDERSESRT